MPSFIHSRSMVNAFYHVYFITTGIYNSFIHSYNKLFIIVILLKAAIFLPYWVCHTVAQGLVNMAYLHRVFLRTVSLFCKLPCTLNLSMDPRSLGHLQPFVRCTGILSMHTPIIVIMKRPSGKSHTSHGKKTRLQKEKIRPTSARH